MLWFWLLLSRHNSVALDLAVSGPASGAYTLMGPELGEGVRGAGGMEGNHG